MIQFIDVSNWLFYVENMFWCIEDVYICAVVSVRRVLILDVTSEFFSDFSQAYVIVMQ